MLTVILLASAAAGYFMSTHGVVFDRSMIVNLVETHPAEAIELMGWRLWGWIAALGVVPALLVWRARLRPQRLVQLMRSKALVMSALAAVLMLEVVPFFES